MDRRRGAGAGGPPAGALGRFPHAPPSSAGGRRGVRRGCRLRGRAQAGAGRNATAAAEPNIGNFNSPLEMPEIEYSPNGWKAWRDMFQFSIGDAGCCSACGRGCLQVCVSILHWRCEEATAYARVAIKKMKEFQFSIGDAEANGQADGVHRKPIAFQFSIGDACLRIYVAPAMN